jgi:hypothetical protein
MDADPTTSERLTQQIEYHSGASRRNRQFHKWLKAGEMLSAVAITYTAWMTSLSVLTGGLGLLVMVLEGLQQLNRYQENWIRHRDTCEKLKREKHLFEAKAGPYKSSDNVQKLLAERLEEIAANERSEWKDLMQSVEAENSMKRM